MNRSPERSTLRGSSSRLDFRSGGWVLLLAAVLVAAIMTWRLTVILPTLDRRAVGDGRNVDSYGFDLSTCLLPRDRIVVAGLDLRKDGLPTPMNPPTLAAGQYKAGTKLGGVRKLVPGDRVIGVALNEQARAYPLWVMNWHEIMNDRVGGRPIAVTYSPLCDSVVVFDRQVAGETLEFGISGLLYNSNLLMYDRRPDAVGESLWCQLQFRAVAGPAAREGRKLEIVPAVVVPWSIWLERHPETTIVLPNPRRKRLYIRDAYQHYFNSDKLRFPVSPLPPPNGWPLKTPIVALRTDGGWEVVSAEEFGTPTDLAGRVAVYSFWFAWHAMHPESNHLRP